VKAYLSGSVSRRQLSEIFDYTPASVTNWVRDYKQENHLGPRLKSHRKAVFTSAELEWLTTLLKEKVDLTLAEIKKYFQKSCSFAGKRTGTRGHSP
jgi:transposase